MDLLKFSVKAVFSVVALLRLVVASMMQPFCKVGKWHEFLLFIHTSKPSKIILH